MEIILRARKKSEIDRLSRIGLEKKEKKIGNIQETNIQVVFGKNQEIAQIINSYYKYIQSSENLTFNITSQSIYSLWLLLNPLINFPFSTLWLESLSLSIYIYVLQFTCYHIYCHMVCMQSTMSNLPNFSLLNLPIEFMRIQQRYPTHIIYWHLLVSYEATNIFLLIC